MRSQFAPKIYLKKAGCVLINKKTKMIGLIYRQKQKDYSFLIDVMEVVDYLIDLHSFDRSELNALKEEKQFKVGKFDKKIKTHYIEMPDNHEELSYYLSKPQKYPQIK